MNAWTSWLLAMPALAASAAIAQPAPPRRLAHDPFDPRVVQAMMRAPASAAAAQSPDGAPAPAPAPAPAAPPLPAELRAVMSGGARPLVNLGGTILGIGDSVEGYRLVEVREDSAVFTRDGQRFERALGGRQEP